MLRFEEAQDLFRKDQNSNNAETYHKAAWKSFLAGRIDNVEMHAAMDELEGFWDANPSTA